jgi:hypothetical protein
MDNNDESFDLDVLLGKIDRYARLWFSARGITPMDEFPVSHLEWDLLMSQADIRKLFLDQMFRGVSVPLYHRVPIRCYIVEEGTGNTLRTHIMEKNGTIAKLGEQLR